MLFELRIAGNHDLPMDKSYRGGKALVPNPKEMQ